jgi:phage host-nuclease inhibitor protein Gam
VTTENAYEIDQPEHDAQTVEEGYHVTTDSAAEWMLRILANNAAEKVRIIAQAQDIAAALDADSARLMYRHGAELEEYCREKLAASGNRRKSVRFLQGTCAFRYQSPAVRLKDPDAALTWCREHSPALLTVETVEKIDSEAFRQQAEAIRKETGELLPGAIYDEGGDNFSLSFPTAAKPKISKK